MLVMPVRSETAIPTYEFCRMELRGKVQRLTTDLRFLPGALVMMIGGTTLLLLLVADVTGVFTSCFCGKRSVVPNPEQPIVCGYNNCRTVLQPPLLQCSQCKRAVYCSRDCQVMAWEAGHKAECHPDPAASGDRHEKTADKARDSDPSSRS